MNIRFITERTLHCTSKHKTKFFFFYICVNFCRHQFKKQKVTKAVSLWIYRRGKWMSKKVEHSGRMVGGRSSVDVQTVWYVLVCPVYKKKNVCFLAILWKLIINTGTSSTIKILYIILLCNSDVLDFDIEFLFFIAWPCFDIY